jgi:putative membrane protein
VSQIPHEPGAAPPTPAALDAASAPAQGEPPQGSEARAQGPVPAPHGDPAAEPRRRLHPLSPLLRGANLVALAIAAISWQGYRDLGLRGWLIAVSCVVVAVLAYSVVSWLFTGYHVVGRELRIYEGWVWRRTRAIPIERLQSVEVVRPLLARAFGLAELRIEVVGASKTEAPLAYLPVQEAAGLRERLLTIVRGAAGATAVGGAPSGAAAGGPTWAGRSPDSAVDVASAGAPAGVGGVAGAAAPYAAPERRIHVVANRDLVISQLLRPQWWALPLAIAAPIFFFAYDNDLTFIGVASMLTAIVGAVQAPVRVLLSDWRFTLATTADELRFHRGLLETRHQTVSPARIQAVAVEWPLLWRGMKWVRAQMYVAGVARERNDQRTGSLLPVGDVVTAERVVAEALPGFRLTQVAVLPVPSRTRWIVPLRRRVLGYQLTETAFVTRDGVLTRRLVVVPYARVQSVRIRQGPLERALRVASVWVDPAGGGVEAVALHRDEQEAKWLVAELAERSRAARHPQH